VVEEDRRPALGPEGDSLASSEAKEEVMTDREWQKRARAVLGGGGWPYGVTDKAQQGRLLEWAEARGVKFSPSARCLHWIAGRRCPEICREGHMSRCGMDHLTGWTRDGKPAILVSQPYVQSAESIAALGAAAAEMGLETRIDGSGWYGHGTICIEFYPKGHPPAGDSLDDLVR
jgi:hypothetical protein